MIFKQVVDSFLACMPRALGHVFAKLTQRPATERQAEAAR